MKVKTKRFTWSKKSQNNLFIFQQKHCESCHVPAKRFNFNKTIPSDGKLLHLKFPPAPSAPPLTFTACSEMSCLPDTKPFILSLSLKKGKVVRTKIRERTVYVCLLCNIQHQPCLAKMTAIPAHRQTSKCKGSLLRKQNVNGYTAISIKIMIEH